MKHLLSILLSAILCATASAQTIKALGFNTTNGQVVANTTNALHFTNDSIAFNVGDLSVSNGAFFWGGQPRWAPEDNSFDWPLAFNGTNTAAATRTNLGLGESSIVRFDQLFATDTVEVGSSSNTVQITTDGIEFGNAALSATTRTNLGLGASNDVEFNTLQLGGSGQMSIRGTAGSIYFYNGVEVQNVLTIPADTDPVEINSQWNNAGVRSNLGLPLAALTNTSNVTMMRALAGSTNTNHPYSGSISVVGTNNTNTLVFSNGILTEVQ